LSQTQQQREFDLFIHGLCKNTVHNSDYTMSNVKWLVKNEFQVTGKEAFVA
jgi:hypothetical protein